MIEFHFLPIMPHPLLKPYVAKMSIFKSSGRLPEIDKKLIVPNANLKLTLTCNNGIAANVAGKLFLQNENKLSLSGFIDTPVNLDPQEDISTCTVVFEINPLGAYRLFSLPYSDFRNQIIELQDLIGNSAKHLQQRLANTDDLEVKVQLLQNFLVQRVENGAQDIIYDHCVNRILASNGLVTVSQLEKETGYSSRWLYSKFSERLGTGPKNFAEIIRFKKCYETYAVKNDLQILKDQVYNYYHDQSHFIRAFKKFTGSTPTDLHNSANELATKHYAS